MAISIDVSEQSPLLNNGNISLKGTGLGLASALINCYVSIFALGLPVANKPVGMFFINIKKPMGCRKCKLHHIQPLSSM